jgi:asparagine synthase (glutamine-hydrolysing)
MSVQFGIWNQDGRPVDSGHVDKARALLAPYGPDGCGSYQRNNISILCHTFHTTKESRREMQPRTTASGAAITWDGRLDNRDELVSECSDTLTATATDVDIVAAAYEKWGTRSFAKLVGDWALSIWDQHHRSLILAKDPIGTRHLYYSLEKGQVSWSSILDPLVLLAGKTFALHEEYIAGWLSFFPATHLTPYLGIHSVAPSSFALIGPGKHTVHKYWDFAPSKRIRYRTDAEYEEHFRAVFRESVRRRLRSDTPVLAELSGGMDSSSIVCMADTIIASAAAETPRLDTISYYNDSEPNWNERPYFSKVEQRRGRKGIHIDVASDRTFEFEFDVSRFAAAPASVSRPSEVQTKFATCLASRGYRILLSGVGGDEVTGGVPTAIPELADLLARAQFRALARQLKVWALNKRRPWIHLLLEMIKQFAPLVLVSVPEQLRPASWLSQEFVKRNGHALTGYPSRLRLLGPRPSFQENLMTLNGLQRQLACSPLVSEPRYDTLYPYLDRMLLEFLFAVPREQVIRPGQRRSLMRRALLGIVPDELLNRKRKAYVVRSPMAALSRAWPTLTASGPQMISTAMGIIDPRCFSEALTRGRQGQQIPLVLLARTLALEAWLQTLQRNTYLPTISTSAVGPVVEQASRAPVQRVSAS